MNTSLLTTYLKVLKTVLLWCCLLASTGSMAQKGLTMDAGMEFGWWLHRLGDSPSDIRKTHHVNSPFVHINYLWTHRHWSWGPTFRGSLFLDDNMRGPLDSRSRNDRIFIAKEDGFVPFIRYGLHLGYQLLHRGSYTFAPAIQYGLFQLWTLHPEKENFGYKHFTEILVSHIWHRPKRDWMLRINYTTQRIFLKQKTHAGEQHHLYSWGVSVGLEF